MRKVICFSECEHDGDLDNYKDDLIACGAEIIESMINYDSEEAAVLIECEDLKEFREKFILTDSYGFSNLSF